MLYYENWRWKICRTICLFACLFVCLFVCLFGLNSNNNNNSNNNFSNVFRLKQPIVKPSTNWGHSKVKINQQFTALKGTSPGSSSVIYDCYLCYLRQLMYPSTLVFVVFQVQPSRLKRK